MGQTACFYISLTLACAASLAPMDPNAEALHARLACSAMHAHAWPSDVSSTSSQDSTMSVCAASSTLPQLALPWHSSRFLVTRRLHLWFHRHERSFILRDTLPALLGAPRTASGILSSLPWHSWNHMHRTCPEAYRCVRPIWRVTRAGEAALAQHAEARVLMLQPHVFRTAPCTFSLCPAC